MYINRNWDLSIEDDFNKNIHPLIVSEKGFNTISAATPVYMENGLVIGWQVKPIYE